MKSSVELHDGVLHQVAQEVIDEADAHEILESTSRVLRENGLSSAPMLVDLSNHHRTTAAARRVLSRGSGAARFPRVAIVGGDVVARTTLKFISEAAGWGKVTRFFRSADEALQWLGARVAG